MRRSMVRYQMSAGDDRPRNLRTRSHKLPNQEKCRLHIVPRKHFKQPLSVDIVRTIVVGKRQMLRVRAVSERPPIKLRRR